LASRHGRLLDDSLARDHQIQVCEKEAAPWPHDHAEESEETSYHLERVAEGSSLMASAGIDITDQARIGPASFRAVRLLAPTRIIKMKPQIWREFTFVINFP
jgi:hypothetical protein